jgi:hypothetical protein
MPQFIEPGFVVLTPDGKIVHTLDRLRTFNADWLRAALVALLRENPAYNAPAGDSADDLIRGGDDDKAFERATAAQKSAILRRAGKPREALAIDAGPTAKARALLASGTSRGRGTPSRRTTRPKRSTCGRRSRHGRGRIPILSGSG